MSNFGPKPELRWIDKRFLRIDPAYQRELSTRSSQVLITRLVQNWKWAHASVLMVVQVAESAWNVIDGQHRLRAAMVLETIRDLPCLVIAAESIEDHARAFVAHNRDRVNLSFLAIFHADVAAGSPSACHIADVCKDVGVTIPRGAHSTGRLRPDQTTSIATMYRILKSSGKRGLISVMCAITAAYPEKRGQLRASLMKAVDVVLRLGVDHRTMVDVLRKTSAEAIDAAAREARPMGMSQPQANAEVLAAMCGTTTLREKARTDRPQQIEKHPSQFRKIASQIIAPPAKTEAASMIEVALRTLRESGITIDRHTGSLPYRMDGKPATIEVIIKRAEQIRAMKGLPTLRKVTG